MAATPATEKQRKPMAIQINVRTENGRIREAVSVARIEEGRWELHKGSKVDPVIWNEKSMREQYGRMGVLFGELICGR